MSETRRSFLTRLAAFPLIGAVSLLTVTPAATQRAVDACRVLGFSVTSAPSGGPALFNIWRRVNDVDSVLAGWIYQDGSTIWSGAMFEALR